ncbi:MAG TPA: 4-alpha-glucanotransferase [Hydrogenophaga sp.]|uniref:4-alpha-glucanotransferase n=1 Tax=Hydrogenophaga sp. TaxID=1904254 RepID=UPI002BAA1944|nr:4-alpha-glucanotransferase [Hydrogenophaga sp.]HMN93667.1 4-alpha-glucanotransferase [Hydrogenophaga sp.]HMP10962.1 4-alpha-glucanotransferase [Hydrogenophaga sp.]
MNTASHPLLHRRSSGVLLHLSCLPGRYGSGDLGDGALHFLDWLAAGSQSLWQILPLTPPGPGHSPYRSPSAFAGNPWLVDLDDLVSRGWLPALTPPSFDASRCDFEQAEPFRRAALGQAWSHFRRHGLPQDRESFRHFSQTQETWLTDYARFMVLTESFGAPWTQWPAEWARRTPSALDRLDAEAAEALGFWRFVQWRFHEQWNRLRAAAHARHIRFVGDMPLFVDHHSVDVWAQPELFRLDQAHEPEVVAGVPPDYFCATGQRWGNPLYRWDVMASDGWTWWIRRVTRLLSLLDLARIDHFRGLEAYWEIPAAAPSAVQGSWQVGPGSALFQALEQALGPLPFIAEDLGVITEAVTRLRQAHGLPGMRVMQFGFDGSPANIHLPHNLEPGLVACSGTHDNDTTLGWWQSLGPDSRDRVRDYLGAQADSEIHWAMMQALSQSVARTFIVPFQDVLGLDGHHRMNRPGQASGCWRWRFDWPMVDASHASRLGAMVRAHGRT